MYATEDYLRYFTRLSGAVEYKGLVLTHVPVHENQLSRWYMNVHGHLHTKRVMREQKYICRETMASEGHLYHAGYSASVPEPDPRYVCVSAEQIDLTPVPFDWILNKWAESH